ncbi:MAG: Os1348 family NHLP clan protein [Candidatus Berkiella sp.]
MSAQSFELILARLYTDSAFRQLFLVNPECALADCDLSEEERVQFFAIDKAGLMMAAQCFLHKRKKRAQTVWVRLRKLCQRTFSRMIFHVPHV